MSVSKRWVIVDWDSDGVSVDPRWSVSASTVAEYQTAVAEDRQEEADDAMTERLSDESGWLVNGWHWEEAGTSH